MVFFISLSSFSSLLTGTPDLALVGGLYNNSSYRIYLKRANVNFCCLQGSFFLYRYVFAKTLKCFAVQNDLR